jgi:hypothetical protein
MTALPMLTAAKTCACGSPMTAKNAHGGERQYCSRDCALAHIGKAKVRDLYVEEVEHLTRCGSSPRQILAALGVGAEALARGLTREGRRDLARPFWRVRHEERVARARAAA